MDAWEGKTKDTLSFEEEVTVPQNIYLKWVRQELEDEEACLELPFMILVLVSFTLMAVLSLNQHLVLSIEQAIEQDILQNANFAFNEYMGHKTLQDVHSVPDFWSWMRLGFLPLVIQPNWMYSEGHARDVLSAFDLNVVPNTVWDMDALLQTALIFFGAYHLGKRFPPQNVSKLCFLLVKHVFLRYEYVFVPCVLVFARLRVLVSKR